MRDKICVVYFLMLFTTSFSAYTQVYKITADTIKLNKEFAEVNNDIDELSAKLTTARNKMPGYKSKADVAESNAEDAAVTSSVQAAKTTEGGVKEARKAKWTSKKAYRAFVVQTFSFFILIVSLSDERRLLSDQINDLS